MKISVAIMSHPSRSNRAKDLYDKLHTMPFTCITPVFDEINDEWETGERSLRLHDDSDWHVVIQDDAIISDSFYDNLKDALTNVPQRSLVSLYLGKVRPNASRVKTAFDDAIRSDSSWLSMPTLLWGVCIAVPTEQIDPMLDKAKAYPRLLYDRRVGQYYLHNKMRVYYAATSLVDHDYTLPSLTGHVTSEPRVCHKFVGDELLAFNSRCVNLW